MSDNINFTQRFYTNIVQECDGDNVIISPCAIYDLLIMLKEGAEDETKCELEKILADGAPTPDNESIITAKLLYAYGIIQDTYAEKIKKTFNRCHLKSFNDEPHNYADEINGIIQTETNQLIKSAVTKKDLTNQRIFLAAAVYFKGLWVHSFETDEPTEFWLSRAQCVNVLMMYTENDFRIFQDEDKTQFITMEFQGCPLSMTFILPKDVEGLPKVETNIAKRGIPFDKIRKKRKEVCTVTMPKFSLDRSYDLINVLRSMGVVTLFQSGTANLSRMMGNTNDLFVTKCQLSSVIKVDENGIEVASVCGGCASDYFSDNNNEILINRPFMFVIADSNVIIFQGRITNPLK